MKQILQNVRTGAIELAELPAPAIGDRQLLVRNAYSLMSPGTEKLALDFASKSLVEKARSRPDLVKQVLDKLRKDGPLPTLRTVMSRLEGPQPLGYSCAGTVIDVGAQVTGFAVGDRVACAGAGYANHAELVAIPENLAVRVPDGVGLDAACFATIGAIALQGLRVAAPTLGEVGVVIGLGLIGQITVQLLRANGCRVLGVDVAPARVEEGLAQGAEWGAAPDGDHASWKVAATGGYGADFAIVTASSSDARPLALAAELCRPKGRIAMVGAFPVEVERRAIYDKELELRMSMSYGPGRYDRSYEELGLDYPLPYVRWTENRNLSAILGLIASGGLALDRLDTQQVAFEDAVRAYEQLRSGERSSLASVFRYAESVPLTRSGRVAGATTRRAPASESPGIAFVGAGNYAKAVLLPALSGERVERRWLVCNNGATARGSAERFGFARFGTDPEEAFADPSVNAVFLATRHDSHARLATQALRAGKAVWLEKPPALNETELTALADAATGGFLAVGYNRRFSSHVRVAREALAARRSPLAIRYTVAAGRTPKGTWITDPREGGGRLIGEACHFVDLCGHLVGAPVQSVYARSLSPDSDADDSVLLVLGYADGSSAAIEYLARTAEGLPKERFEASADGCTVQSENFRETRILGRGARDHKTLSQDKGQEAAVAAVLQAIRGGSGSPFALEEICAVSRATFAAQESLRSREVVRW